jgi:hypothetical protein
MTMPWGTAATKNAERDFGSRFVLMRAEPRAFVARDFLVYGPTRIDMVPRAPLQAGVRYTLESRDAPPRRSRPIATFAAGADDDTTPPVIVRAGAPAYRYAPPHATCGARRWVEIAIGARHDSPLVVSVWALRGPIDFARVPDEYAHVVGGHIEVQGQGAAGAKFAARYALAAVDVAGNLSEGLVVPGGRRLPQPVLEARQVLGEPSLDPAPVERADSTLEDGVPASAGARLRERGSEGVRSGYACA